MDYTALCSSLQGKTVGEKLQLCGDQINEGLKAYNGAQNVKEVSAEFVDAAWRFISESGERKEISQDQVQQWQVTIQRSHGDLLEKVAQKGKALRERGRRADLEIQKAWSGRGVHDFMQALGYTHRVSVRLMEKLRNLAGRIDYDDAVVQIRQQMTFRIEKAPGTLMQLTTNDIETVAATIPANDDANVQANVDHKPRRKRNRKTDLTFPQPVAAQGRDEAQSSREKDRGSDSAGSSNGSVAEEASANEHGHKETEMQYSDEGNPSCGSEDAGAQSNGSNEPINEQEGDMLQHQRRKRLKVSFGGDGPIGADQRDDPPVSSIEDGSAHNRSSSPEARSLQAESECWEEYSVELGRNGRSPLPDHSTDFVSPSFQSMPTTPPFGPRRFSHDSAFQSHASEGSILDEDVSFKNNTFTTVRQAHAAGLDSTKHLAFLFDARSSSIPLTGNQSNLRRKSFSEELNHVAGELHSPTPASRSNIPPNTPAGALASLQGSSELSTTCMERVLETFRQDGLFILDPSFLEADRTPQKDLEKAQLKTLGHYNRILAPLHHGNHWTIALVNLRSGEIQWYNPLNQGKYTSQAQTTLEAFGRFLSKHSEVDTDLVWKINHVDRAVQQTDSTSCGVFCLIWTLVKIHDQGMPSQIVSSFWRRLFRSFINHQRDPDTSVQTRRIPSPSHASPFKLNDVNVSLTLSALLEKESRNSDSVLASIQRERAVLQTGQKDLKLRLSALSECLPLLERCYHTAAERIRQSRPQEDVLKMHLSAYLRLQNELNQSEIQIGRDKLEAVYNDTLKDIRRRLEACGKRKEAFAGWERGRVFWTEEQQQLVLGNGMVKERVERLQRAVKDFVEHERVAHAKMLAEVGSMDEEQLELEGGQEGRQRQREASKEL